MEEAADLVEDETPGQEEVVEKLKVRVVEEAADLVEARHQDRRRS